MAVLARSDMEAGGWHWDTSACVSVPRSGGVVVVLVIVSVNVDADLAAASLTVRAVPLSLSREHQRADDAIPVRVEDVAWRDDLRLPLSSRAAVVAGYRTGSWCDDDKGSHCDCAGSESAPKFGVILQLLTSGQHAVLAISTTLT